MKKANRQQQRQRQKVARRTVVIICAATVFCMVAGIVIFLNMTHVENAGAKEINILTEPDQVFTTEKEIAAPVIVQRQSAGPATLWAKNAKVLPAASASVTH